jgi:hypothetical protein
LAALQVNLHFAGTSCGIWLCLCICCFDTHNLQVENTAYLSFEATWQWANFSWDIAESSRDHSPQQSKNISVEDMGRLGVITENIEITALNAESQLKANGNTKGNVGFIMGDKVINNVSFILYTCIVYIFYYLCIYLA